MPYLIDPVARAGRCAPSRDAAQRSLSIIAQKIDAAREAERVRLARELHDELGAQLTALQLAGARLSQRPPRNAAEWQTMCAQLQHAIDATQDAAGALVGRHQPPALDAGLVPALRAHVHQCFADNSPAAIWRCDDDTAARVAQLSPPAALALYRIAQEALTNIARHAHATRVMVALDGGRSALKLTVSDDGAGLAPGARHRKGHFGLSGMRERCVALGGSLRVSSTPGAGTTVCARLPWQHILSSPAGDAEHAGAAASPLAFHGSIT